jgi:hypothetical protein
MMDWYIIEYLYPESFKRFIDVTFPNIGIVSTNSLSFYKTKNLYNFFDKEGLYFNVEQCCPKRWIYTISIKNIIVLGPINLKENTKEDIEIEGFTECFKILDKILITHQL